MNIPIWLFIVLICTNAFTWLFLVLLINVVCYIHDMIEVSIDMKRKQRKIKKNSIENEIKEDNNV